MKTITTKKIPAIIMKNKIYFHNNLKFLTVLIVLLFCSTIYSQQNNCSATLNAEKNRNSRSIPPDGTFYKMQITNTSLFVNSYIIVAENNNNNSENIDKSSTSSNVNLTFKLLDENKNSIDKVKLNPGETLFFLVHAEVPSGTNYNKWCNTQIIAKSISCSNYEVETVLHTLVISSNSD